MRTAREWVLAQPGADDMSIAELAQAVAVVEARDREVIEAVVARLRPVFKLNHGPFDPRDGGDGRLNDLLLFDDGPPR